MSTPSLEIKELAFAYPDGNQALYGVNLSVQKGERVALLGPNGAGKTTLVMHLNGIHPTSHGSVHVAGQLVDAKDKASLKEIRAKVGIVFQDPDDQLFMPTVGEDIAFGPYNMGKRGAELDAIVDEALNLVGMIEFMFVADQDLSIDEDAKKQLPENAAEIVSAAILAIKDLADFSTEALQQALSDALVEGLGEKPRNAFGPVRTAISGRRVSPPLFECMEILGKQSSLARLEAFAQSH